MKEKFAKLIDLKSIITFLLVATLVFLVIYATLTKSLTDPLFLLFSNIISMTVTYFFTRKADEKKDGEEDDKNEG